MNDDEKTRMGLALYCKQNNSEVKPQANGRLLKFNPSYSLTIHEVKFVCRWLKEDIRHLFS